MNLNDKIQKQQDILKHELEKVGTFTNELLNSNITGESEKLTESLTLITSNVFKTYVSTPNLKIYICDDEIKANRTYHKDFKEYRQSLYKIIFYVENLKEFDKYFRRYEMKTNLTVLLNYAENLQQDLENILLLHKQYCVNGGAENE